MTTPWPDLLRLAAERFHIPPDAFWRLSLMEWRALTGPDVAPVLDRAGFEALASAYPDYPPNTPSWPGLSGPPMHTVVQGVRAA